MSYPPPMLIDQLECLSWMTSSADQQLGQDAFERFAELNMRLMLCSTDGLHSSNVRQRWGWRN